MERETSEHNMGAIARDGLITFIHTQDTAMKKGDQSISLRVCPLPIVRLTS